MGRYAVFVLMLSLAIGVLVARPVVADEERPLGPYRVTAGFAHSPLYAMDGNAFVIRVRDGDRPVTGLEETLRLRISLPNQASETVPIHPIASEPGAYQVDIILPRVGLYSFQVLGTVGGQAVEERFTTGQGGIERVIAHERVYPRGSWAVILLTMGIYLIGLAWLVARGGRRWLEKRRRLALGSR